MKKLLLILICLFVSFEVKSELMTLVCTMKETHNKKLDSFMEMKLDKNLGYFCPFNYKHCSHMKYEETIQQITSTSKGDEGEKSYEFVLNKYDGSFLLIIKGEITETRRGQCYDKNQPKF